MALTNKRRVFVEEYLRCWNASEAARRAEYAYPGTEGHRLLQNAEIQAYIKARLEQVCMSADEVLIRLAEKARFDFGRFVYRRGMTDELIIEWEALVEAQLTHLVKAVYRTAHGTRIEFHDPEHALELIGKAHGLFVDRQEIEIEHSASDDVLTTIGDALSRGYADSDADPEAD